MTTENKTVALVEDFGKAKFLAIRVVNPLGDIEMARQVVGFGLVKAKAILRHIEDIEKFVRENEK